MDIELTRKKLKLSKDKYTDKQVQEIIEYTESLADIFLDEYMKKGKVPKAQTKTKKISLFTEMRYNNSGNKSKIQNTSGKKKTLE